MSRQWLLSHTVEVVSTCEDCITLNYRLGCQVAPSAVGVALKGLPFAAESQPGAVESWVAKAMTTGLYFAVESEHINEVSHLATPKIALVECRLHEANEEVGEAHVTRQAVEVEVEAVWVGIIQWLLHDDGLIDAAKSRRHDDDVVRSRRKDVNSKATLRCF